MMFSAAVVVARICSVVIVMLFSAEVVVLVVVVGCLLSSIFEVVTIDKVMAVRMVTMAALVSHGRLTMRS